MNILNKLMVGSAGLAMIAGAAAPAAAQSYGYPQYGNQNQNSGAGVVGSIINNLLGNRQGRDRMAVEQCARAAEARVNGDSRYGAYGQTQYQGQYQGQYGQGYNSNRSLARVVAVTQVTRNTNATRVTGLIDTGRGNRGQGYGNQGYNQGYQGQGYQGQGYQGQGYQGQGYQGQGYNNASQTAELTFNCRVDVRGQILRLNIDRNMEFRRGS